MASTAKLNLLRHNSVRFFSATSARCNEKLSVKYRVSSYADPSMSMAGGFPGASVEVARNGISVGASNPNSAMASVTVAVRAGPRFESYKETGASHMLRVCTGIGNKHSTHFGFTRNMNQPGATMTNTGNRELLFYTVRAHRDAIVKLLPFVRGTVCCQLFRHWEIADISPQLSHEIDVYNRDGRALLMDALHQAAFRRGLGAINCAPRHAVGNLDTDLLSNFISRGLWADSVAVAGVGVDMDTLLQFADSIEIGKGSSGQQTIVPSTFNAGDARLMFGGPLTYAAIAGEGPALKSPKEVAAAHVFKHALGTGSSLKWGQANSSILGKNVTSGAKEGAPVGATGFTAHYSDSGLTGVLLAAGPKDIGGVVKSAIAVLKSPKLSGDDVKRGMAAAKVCLVEEMQKVSSRTEALAENGVSGGGIENLEAIIVALDSVSAADVSAVASKVSQKLAMGVVGNIYDVPYVDEA